MIRLAVRCRPDQAELVLAELTVLAPNGVEESTGPGYIEYAIYGAAGELPDIGEVEVASGDGLVEVVSTEVADDWADRWRAFHKPLMISGPAGDGAIWLRPPWEPARPDEFEVVIDPGQAFGTGAHPTTRLCLELMLGLVEKGLARGELVDLGSGSGVLAIAARMLGWNPVRGYDHEVAAVEASIENADVNEVLVDFERLDLKAGLPALAPIAVANLTAPLLEMVALQLDPEDLPATLICSGLLATERHRVEKVFGHYGYAAREFREIENWGGLLMELDV